MCVFTVYERSNDPQNQTISIRIQRGCDRSARGSDPSNPSIDALYEAAREKGALGGKILGAGGGGYLLLFCEFGKKHIVAEHMESMGAQAVDFHFVDHGLETWEVAA